MIRFLLPAALLQQGTYDRYYFICNPSSLTEACCRLALYANHQRAECISRPNYRSA
jgi:hypothetical protein